MLKVLAKVSGSDITFYFMMGAKKHIHFLSRQDSKWKYDLHISIENLSFKSYFWKGEIFVLHDIPNNYHLIFLWALSSSVERTQMSTLVLDLTEKKEARKASALWKEVQLRAKV